MYGKTQSFYFPSVYYITKFYKNWRQKSSPASNGINGRAQNGKIQDFWTRLWGQSNTKNIRVSYFLVSVHCTCTVSRTRKFVDVSTEIHVAVQSQLCNTSCSILTNQSQLFDPAVQSQLFYLSCSIPVVRSWLFNLSCSISAVQSQLFNLSCSTSAVQSQLFNPSRSIPAVQYHC